MLDKKCYINQPIQKYISQKITNIALNLSVKQNQTKVFITIITSQ